MKRWQDIEGFGEHDFEGFYERMVAEIPNGATFVEVGIYHGRSLLHLATVLGCAGKKCDLVGVDIEARDAMSNLAGTGVRLLIGDSVQIARKFRDESCYCVFLDGAHTPHEAVAKDIDAWMPKVKPDGWLAGHDARWHTVIEPVHAKLEFAYHNPKWDNVWWAPKQPVMTGVDIHARTTIPKKGCENYDAHIRDS